MIGNLPEKLIYISKAPCKTEWEWDDFQRTTKMVREDVLPTFVADPTRPKTVETGLHWAEGWGERNKSITQITVDNKPFPIRILSLEKRSEGGRAYKCLIGPEKYYVDLREDVLLDTILEAGISKGGVPNALFVWGKVGSQMKLVRVGSDLHKELIKTTEDGKKSKLTNLEIGGVYQNKKGDMLVYMGQYWVLDYDDIKSNSGWREEVTGHANYRWTKRQLWFDIPRWQIKKSKEFSEKIIDWNSYYSLKWVKGATVINKVSQIELPSDWNEKVSNRVIQSYKEHTERYEKKGDDSYTFSSRLYYAKYLSLKPATETPEISPNPFCDIIRQKIGEIPISTK